MITLTLPWADAVCFAKRPESLRKVLVNVSTVLIADDEPKSPDAPLVHRFMRDLEAQGIKCGFLYPANWERDRVARY